MRISGRFWSIFLQNHESARKYRWKFVEYFRLSPPLPDPSHTQGCGNCVTVRANTPPSHYNPLEEDMSDPSRPSPAGLPRPRSRFGRGASRFGRGARLARRESRILATRRRGASRGNLPESRKFHAVLVIGHDPYIKTSRQFSFPEEFWSILTLRIAY